MTSHTDIALGRFEEFRSWAKAEFKHLRDNQLLIIGKLDRINQDRWTMYGKMTVINAMLVMAIELLARKVFN
jgi:hypothetical protein